MHAAYGWNPFHAIAQAASSVANVANDAASSVVHTVSHAVSDAPAFVAKFAQNPRGAVMDTVNALGHVKVGPIPLGATNLIWLADEAARRGLGTQLYQSLSALGPNGIPGSPAVLNATRFLGTLSENSPVIKAAVAAAMAVGQGANVKDAAMSAVRSGIPAPAQAAFDAGVGVVASHGNNLDAIAVDLVRKQLPPATQAAFDTGVAATLGRAASLRDATIAAGKRALGPNPFVQGAYDIGVGLSKSANLHPEILQRVASSLPKRADVQAAFQRGVHAVTAAKAAPKASPPMLTHAQKASRRALAQRTLTHAIGLVRRAETHDARALSWIAQMSAKSRTGDRHAVAAMRILQIARDECRRRGRAVTGSAAYGTDASSLHDLGHAVWCSAA